MGRQSLPEDQLIPPQDNRICGVICLCQMTAVLSCVALVYLSVAIYMPSMRAFQSGINETPVMCTTTRNISVESGDWGSCGEWCLSKSSGDTTQIYVNIRTNGTNLVFQNCTNTWEKTCIGIDREKIRKYTCIRDECKGLNGTFNCTMGECINITDVFQCEFRHVDEPLKCNERRGKITCIEIDGLFDCKKGKCQKILPPYNCERRCVDIRTRLKNLVVLSGDRVFLSQCKKAMVLESEKIVWTESDDILMTSCYHIEVLEPQEDMTDVHATDCVNGTLLEKNSLGDTTNYTYLSNLSYFNTKQLDETGEVTPLESLLIIANDSKLLINLEGCVNTLRGECLDFFKEYGRDGSDHNARARFPCFYSEDNQEFVVARFDLEETYMQFLIASIIPATLFVVSCIILILCQRTVVVGDDARMRFKACSAEEMEGGAEGGGEEGAMAL